jgi:hypothetical protein
VGRVARRDVLDLRRLVRGQGFRRGRDLVRGQVARRGLLQGRVNRQPG